MAETGPRVTVLIVTYNRPALLAAAIKSAAKQSFRDLEILVVCDSSTDGSREVVELEAKHDPRIRYLEVPRAGQIGIVSNAGLRAARGAYIAILDDDDEWCDGEKLAKQVAYLDTHPEVIACGGGFIMVDDAGRELGRVIKPETMAAIRRVALVANPMANGTTLFRRDAAQAAGGYDETMLEFADWDFWLKLGRIGDLYNFPEYFLRYRMWERGASFARQRRNAISALRIAYRYRSAYPGGIWGLCASFAYAVYAMLPSRLKAALNSPLSRLKKRLFAGSRSGA